MCRSQRALALLLVRARFLPYKTEAAVLTGQCVLRSVRRNIRASSAHWSKGTVRASRVVLPERHLLQDAGPITPTGPVAARRNCLAWEWKLACSRHQLGPLADGAVRERFYGRCALRTGSIATHSFNRGGAAMHVLVAALVAAGLAGCSTNGLSGASRPSPAATHAQTSDSAPGAVTTGPSPSLGALVPVTVLGEPKPNGPVIAQRLNEQGPGILTTFTPSGNALFATYSCLGPGKFDIKGLFDVTPCDGTTSTITVRGQTGKALTLHVNVDASTRWRLLLQDGQEVVPPKR